jgi:hypothetical protein
MLADRQMTEMKQKEEHHNLEKERLANAAKQAKDYAKQQAENFNAVKEAAEESHKKMQETLEKQHQTQIEQLQKQTKNQVILVKKLRMQESYKRFIKKHGFLLLIHEFVLYGHHKS